MKRQDTRAKGNGKKRMRILAVTLSVSVLFTTCPDLPETFSVLAAEEAGESETETPAEDDGEEDAGENAGAENGNGQETHTVTLPEYYAENVISVQILENTQEEKREETVTIGGVTWQSAPAYDGDTEGTYLFTAALPDEYAPAKGVSLPRITVTVRAERRRVMAAKAGARAAIAEGSVGAGWTLDTDGKLTIYSDAGMSGWITAYTNSKWYDRVISLEVKNGVTRLADGCCTNSNNLKSVKLPETLEEIGAAAFQACKSLAGIEIPASVTKIGAGAFMNCSSLESVKMLGATPPEFVKGTEGFFTEWYFMGTKFYGKTGGIYVPLGSAEAYKSAWFVSQLDDYRNNIVGAPLVTYDYATNGGTSATKTAMLVEQNTKVDLTPSATKKDWEFVGWHTDKNATTKLTSHTIGTANITLYAIYEKKLTLTCYSGNGSSETKTAVVYNSGTTGKVSLPAGESLSGYAFDGYVGTAGAFSGDVYQAGAEYTLSADTSLYGLYTKTITVSYDANGGKGSVAAQTLSRHANVSSTVAYETAPTVSLSGGAALSRDGYKFKGWLKDSGTGTSVTAAGTSVTVEKDTTYYAKWEVVSYKITYQLNDGKVTGNPEDYTVESEAITLKNRIREGYFFTGWSGTGLTGSANTRVTIAKGSTGDRAYTANWKVADYKVTLHGNGGSGTDLTSYTDGKGATLPKDWTKTGYTFGGWYANANCGGEKVTQILTTDTGAKEYWAKWIDDIAPVIGDLQYSYEPKNLWHWLIGKDSLVITVPVTEEGSGADEIIYSVTPEDGGTETKSAAIENGAAEITIAPVFKGTIAITCTDKAGNTSAGVTVGADLNADGVIIEDHAPEITVLADRGTSDTEPTQPAFTIPAEEIPTGVTEITVTATDNAGNKTVKTLIIRVKGPEEKPAAVIAYREEKLTYLVPGAAYLIDGKPYTADEEGGIPIAEGWFGSTVSIIKQGNDIETTDSPAQSLPIPARPPKPAPTGVDVDTPGGTGKLTDLTAGTAYEVSADGGKTWTSKTADENGVITRLAPGIYLVRVEAGVSSFASKSSDPAAIGAYQMKVTFVANGDICSKRLVNSLIFR